jgi:hypothetical protein
MKNDERRTRSMIKELGKKLLVFVLGSLVTTGILTAASNVMDGKDVLGREPKEKPRMDWKGYVHLNEKDYRVV